MRLNEQ